LTFSNFQWKYKLLERGNIISDSAFVIDTAQDLFVDDFEILRRTLTGESLTIDGTLFEDLVKITLSYTRSLANDINLWDFYFHHELGLVAIYTFEEFISSEVWIYCERREDILPLPMVR
jgi:hypothetical protein